MAYYDPNSAYGNLLSSFTAPNPYSTGTDVYAENKNHGGHGRRSNNPGNIGDEQAANVADELARARQAARDAGYPRNAKKAARQMGLDTLLALLASGGHTDPARLNTQLTDISRAAEAGQNQFDEYLASQGLSGSGVGLATRAAIGASGADQRSRAIANENALAEERRRQDLEFIMSMILGPRIARRGQDKALEAARAGGGSNLGAYGNLLGGLGNLVGSFGGGYGSTGSSPSYGGQYIPGNDPYTGQGTGNMV